MNKKKLISIAISVALTILAAVLGCVLGVDVDFSNVDVDGVSQVCYANLSA